MKLLITGGAGYIGSHVVIAKAALAKEIIGWDSKYSDLDTIINSTWEIYNKIY